MKKIFMMMFLGLIIISMVGVVSAKTDVVGVIYNEDYSQEISGASVNITCVQENVTSFRNTTSSSDGRYGVEFLCSECNTGDIVTVTAIKGDLSGVETGIVHDFGLTVKVAIVNVTVPEFGLFIGILTLFGAIGVFFFVRR